jgi:hypothetical protein
VRPSRLRAVRALALAAALGCGGLHAPVLGPTDAAALADARATLEAAAARRGDIRLVEGGLVLQGLTYAPQHSLHWELPEPTRPEGILDPRDHWVVREEVLVGPREVYVELARVRAVWVHAWAVGHGVELELDGEPDRVVLPTADRAEAELLAAALEHLRRASVSEESPAPR